MLNLVPFKLSELNPLIFNDLPSVKYLSIALSMEILECNSIGLRICPKIPKMSCESRDLTRSLSVNSPEHHKIQNPCAQRFNKSMQQPETNLAN